MLHTFLFEPAVWIATGTFWRGDGEPLEAVGRTEIAHREQCWLLSGNLKVLGSPPVEFVHAYLIEPPAAGGGPMKWTFENETFGKLSGTYSVVDRSILSVFGTEATGFHGMEHLGQLDDDHYATVGVLLQQDKIIYSWSMRLTREAAVARA
jgi:hypothetical protein